MLVYDDKVPIHFWRIAIVTGVLPSRNSEIKGALVRIVKTNTILKRPANKLFIVENTYMTLTKQIRQGYKSSGEKLRY